MLVALAVFCKKTPAGERSYRVVRRIRPHLEHAATHPQPAAICDTHNEKTGVARQVSSLFPPHGERGYTVARRDGNKALL